MLWVIAVLLTAPESVGDTTVPGRGFVVIVHSEHQGQGIRRAELAQVFLGRATRWDDRTVIESVDQSLSSSVRAAFCRDVLGLEPRAVLQYWQSQLQRGTGLRPPSVKRSDEDVVKWVSERVGRIGYVAPDAPLAANVKPVTVLEAAPQAVLP